MYLVKLLICKYDARTIRSFKREFDPKEDKKMEDLFIHLKEG